MNPGRVAAVVRRQFYVTIHSPTRLIELAFWPIVDLILWGMITVFLLRSGVDLPTPVAFFLGGLLLWDLVFRAKNGVALCFLEEIHSQNLISVLASPITSGEYLTGAVVFGLGKVAVTWTVMAGLAWALFSFGVLDLVYGAIAFWFARRMFGTFLRRGFVTRYM